MFRLPPDSKPRFAVRALLLVVAAGGTSEQRRALTRQNRSILDYVRGHFDRLTRTLGPGDRAHVDEYLDSVREVERRIQAVERLGDTEVLTTVERPCGIPERFDEHVKLMYELQWLAFQADLTRVVTFMLGRELNFRTYPEIGLTQGHHTMSHHGEQPERIATYARLNTYQTELRRRAGSAARGRPRRPGRGSDRLPPAGADPNAAGPDGTAALHWAVHNANYDVASVLLDYGADPNAAVQGWTALHEIALVRRWNRGFNLPGPEQDDDLSGLDLVRKLVVSGANVDARQTEQIEGGGGLNRPGTTPFLLATRPLDLPYMRALLELGADAALATEDGTSAVMVAAGVGQGIGSSGSSPGSIEEALAALELTLAAAAGTVNDIDSRNETPLHGAMYRGALMRERGLPVPPVEWDGPAAEALQ